MFNEAVSLATLKTKKATEELYPSQSFA